jgi:hypothetical protein
VLVIKLKVTPSGGGKTASVEVTSQDVYRWEKGGRGRTMAQMYENMSITAMYQLGHLACRRLGSFAGNLDEFIDTHVIDINKDENNNALQDALLDELTEWRELFDNVEADSFAAQLDERISELQRPEGEPDPTRAGA